MAVKKVEKRIVELEQEIRELKFDFENKVELDGELKVNYTEYLSYLKQYENELNELNEKRGN